MEEISFVRHQLVWCGLAWAASTMKKPAIWLRLGEGVLNDYLAICPRLIKYIFSLDNNCPGIQDLVPNYLSNVQIQFSPEHPTPVPGQY